MDYINPQFLTSIEWLKNNLNDENLRIFDCTTFLEPDPDTTYRIVSGRNNYELGHIPGSAFLDLQDDLSDQSNKLRFTLPEEKDFEKAAGHLGISNDHHLVFYSCTFPMWATRLWWMFRIHGHSKVSVLNGGIKAWKNAGYELSKENSVYGPAVYSARFNSSGLADKDSVLQAIEDNNICILNALGRNQHTGESPGYSRPGRIAGSDNLPAMDLVDPQTGLFLSASEMNQQITKTNAGGARQIITYCGGGIAASTILFAFALLGRESQTALYDGSLSEWSSDPGLPMEIG